MRILASVAARPPTVQNAGPASAAAASFTYTGRIRQWISSGPSECPFVKSRWSHRSLPYASPHRRTRVSLGRSERNATTGRTCRIHRVTTQRRALRACGPELGDTNAVITVGRLLWRT